MKVIKIPVHSIIDVITNSSTEIYTFYGGCVEPAKDLIKEMFKAFNIDKPVDEVFKIFVLADDVHRYLDAEDRWPSGMTEDQVITIYNTIAEGNLVEKPEWFKEVEDDDSHGEYDYAPPLNSLYIIPTDDKYIELGKKLHKFLTSTEDIECGC